MTVRFTEPGQSAVDRPASGIKGIETAVLEPGLRFALDEPSQVVQLPLVPVKAASTSPVTINDTEHWLRDVITAWQGAANDALDRATSIISGTKDVNMFGTLGNSLDLGGALLGPITPWVGGASSALAILFKDVIGGSPADLDIEGYRSKIIGIIDKITEKFLEDIPANSKTLFDAAQHFNLSKNAGQENTLLSVLSANAVKKSGSGLVTIDESRLRAEIELGYLISFAASGEKWKTATGASGPYVLITEEYAVRKTKAKDGTTTSPDTWRYVRSQPKITTYFLPGWKARVRSLLKLLDVPLKVSPNTIPLYVEFDIENLGKYEFVTHTALWQPPSTFEIEFQKHTSEGNVIGPEGYAKMIVAEKTPSLSVGDIAVFTGLVATTPRYQGYSSYSFSQIAGMIMTREAWRGPFPEFKF